MHCTKKAKFFFPPSARPLRFPERANHKTNRPPGRRRRRRGRRRGRERAREERALGTSRRRQWKRRREARGALGTAAPSPQVRILPVHAPEQREGERARSGGDGGAAAFAPDSAPSKARSSPAPLRPARVPFPAPESYSPPRASFLQLHGKRKEPPERENAGIRRPGRDKSRRRGNRSTPAGAAALAPRVIRIERARLLFRRLAPPRLPLQAGLSGRAPPGGRGAVGGPGRRGCEVGRPRRGAHPRLSPDGAPCAGKETGP